MHLAQADHVCPRTGVDSGIQFEIGLGGSRTSVLHLPSLDPQSDLQVNSEEQRRTRRFCCGGAVGEDYAEAAVECCEGTSLTIYWWVGSVRSALRQVQVGCDAASGERLPASPSFDGAKSLTVRTIQVNTSF
jgi:hypothetical protein